MNDCRTFRDLIEELQSGELPAADLQHLQEHCEVCHECGALLDAHEELQIAGLEIPDPTSGELRDIREAVLAEIASRGAPRVRRGFWTDLGRMWNSHPLPAGLATAAVLAAVFLLGRWSPGASALAEGRLVRELGQQAARHTVLDDSWDTPFSFANVAFRPQGDDGLAMSFDVSRHVEVQTTRDSPLAREILLHAILDPSSIGSRFAAMDLASSLADDRLKGALILTMHNDPSLTVRLNALSILARYSHDTQVQDALLQTLQNDEEVQMRLLALEQLTSRKVGLDTIRSAVEKTGRIEDAALFEQVSALPENY